MGEFVLQLIFSSVAFGAGYFMAYQISRNRDKWDDFWAQQNRQRFLAPKSWAGSVVSKWLSYLFAAILLIGGLLGMLSSILNLLAHTT